VRSLATMADTASFFQVGLSIALTLGTSSGINDRATAELLGWTTAAVLVARAVSVALVGGLVNYFRRPDDRIPGSWLVLLWHAGLRGVGTYAFALVFPSDNRDLLVDVTAVVVLATVVGLGSTTKPLVHLLRVPVGVDGDAAVEAAAAAAATGGSRSGAAGGSGGAGGGVGTDGTEYPPHAALIMSGGRPFRVFRVSGARVYVPVAGMSPAERAVSWLSRLDAALRLYISGIVRED
jgi:hypothetical protein